MPWRRTAPQRRAARRTAGAGATLDRSQTRCSTGVGATRPPGDRVRLQLPDHRSRGRLLPLCNCPAVGRSHALAEHGCGAPGRRGAGAPGRARCDQMRGAPRRSTNSGGSPSTIAPCPPCATAPRSQLMSLTCGQRHRDHRLDGLDRREQTSRGANGCHRRRHRTPQYRTS